ncbi:MAG: hypothetical protein FWH35_06860, partial [Treponema sp.]|nr:hypothetical protein [Treponema sp.]
YFNNMWQVSSTNTQAWLQSKHIFVGDTRIATKSSYDDTGTNYGFEEKHQYWYHGDHLGSAQLITNYQGLLHERIEYAPYGELWIEHRYETDSFALPYLFTGKELDPETNLYYYGARYLDPKRSRWISTDPAMGEYIPGAPVNDEARKRNGNLPGMGGVYNLLNLHTYAYTHNNPIKMKDPDGEQNIPGIFGPQDFFDFAAFVGDPFANLLNLFHRADSGDQAAKAYAGYLWHQAGRSALETISEKSSQATLAFMAVGAFDAAAVSSGIGMIADIALTVDDVLSGNYSDAMLRGGAVVAGVILSQSVKSGVNAVANKGLQINIGKNGLYYSLGRRGAMQTWRATKALIKADIALGKFGEVSPQIAGEIVNMAKQAYKAVKSAQE